MTMRQAASKNQYMSYLVRVGLLAALYFAGGKFGLMLSSVEGIVTLVWPPTGIALAALLLFGYQFWPGVALGAFLVNISAGEPLSTVIGISIGNTLEALVGAYLLRQGVGFRNSLERLQDVLGLVGTAAISPIVSATIGTTSLGLTGIIPWTDYGSTWWVWWLGDALGALVVAPVLLTWETDSDIDRQPRSLLEAVALFVSLVIVSQIAFGGWFAPYLVDVRLSFILLPFLVWAALRFGQRGAVTATLIGTGMAIWGTAHGFGPFVLETVHLSLIFLGSFMGAVAIMAMLLAAALAERKQAENVREQLWRDLVEERAQLKQLTETLEEQVEQRTAQVRSLASVLTLAEQQERNRISQVLHDDLQQLLYSLQMRLRTLNFQLSTEANAPVVGGASELPTLKEQLDKMSEILDQVIQVTRTLVIELNPPALQSAGLNEALQWILSYMKEAYDLDVDLSAQEEYQISDKDICALLVRMVRELLFNVVKHAGTNKAQVELWQAEEMLAIRVEDRGKGFDLQLMRDNPGKSASGFGLFRMDERLKLIGGRLNIDSAPGQGTRITMMIPI